MTDRVHDIATVESQTEIAEGIFRLRFRSAALAARALPGQFVNVLLREGYAPLLRRPFSISFVDGALLTIVYNVIGRGTALMAAKRPGDTLDVLGPLGKPFRIDGQFQTAVIVAGGLGVAPFPFLTAALEREGKAVRTYVGARTARQIVSIGLRAPRVATDDGSTGFHGTVVDLLEDDFRRTRPVGVKIFGCGPMPMLKALSAFAGGAGLECELSLEGDMACGIGLCQGCAVEKRDGDKRYALVCVDGPTFKSSDIILP